jgi:hypothetical protein
LPNSTREQGQPYPAFLVAFAGVDDFVTHRRRRLGTDDFDGRPEARDDQTEQRIVALRFILVAAQSQQNQ